MAGGGDGDRLAGWIWWRVFDLSCSPSDSREEGQESDIKTWQEDESQHTESSKRQSSDAFNNKIKKKKKGYVKRGRRVEGMLIRG